MRWEKVPGLLAAGSLAAAYTGDFARVSELYLHDPGREASFVARAQQLSARQGADRSALAAALEEYNRRIGNRPAALANARRLADAETLAIVTGQQAGVLTGPLYTVYKALQAVRLAEEMAERLGRPVVPVFWIASEDHDLTEIDHLDLTDREGRLQRLRLQLEAPSHRSAGAVEAGQAAQDLLQEVLQHLPETEFTPDLASALEGLTAAGGSLADWFARIMAWLLGDRGLVLLDPMLPDLRRLAGPFVNRLLQRSQALAAAVRQGEEKVRGLGFQPALQAEADAAHLFFYEDGARLPLFRREGGFATRGGPLRSLDDLHTLIQTEPERFSGSVVTRPLIQDYLLPTLAYVAGPGEISYYGLYRPVYAAAGLEAPVFVPRASFTLVEPAAARALEKQGLTVERALSGLEAARREVLEREDRIGLTGLFAAFRQDFDRRYGQVIEQVLTLDRSLEQVAQENVRQIHAQFARLEEKARQQHRKNSEVAMRQFDRLALLLTPRQQPQERVFNIMSYLARFGPAVLDAVAGVPAARGGHFAVWLGGA
ncbi:MAG: bacillithiol biosynthesis cysteine-adding enzyme BshC [Bacillota bacterium]